MVLKNTRGSQRTAVSQTTGLAPITTSVARSGTTSRTTTGRTSVSQNNNTVVTTTQGAGSRSTTPQKTTVKCEDLESGKISLTQLEEILENPAKYEFECKRYPCVINGIELREQEKAFLTQNGFTLIKCPEKPAEPPPPTIIPCEEIKNYDPFQLADMINNGTHEVAKNCVYPCYFKGQALNDQQKTALLSIGIPINKQECPCPPGQEKKSNGECVDIKPEPEPEPSPQEEDTPQQEPIPKKEEDNGPDEFDTTGLCPEGKTWSSTEQRCVDINPCPPGFIYDPTDKKNPCKQPPECDESQGLRKNPQTGKCESICQRDEYWNGKECVPVPQCGPGTTWDPKTNSCIPTFDEIECGDGTIRQGDVCVSIYGPPEPPPPDVNVTVVFPPNSGNQIVEEPDPDNSTKESTILESQNCEDPPPPPPPPEPIDPNKNGPTIKATSDHIYVLSNKVGIEQEYINYPYRARGVDDTIRATTGYFWYFEDRELGNLNDKLIPVYRNSNNSNEALLRYIDNFSNRFPFTEPNGQLTKFRLYGIKNNIALSNIDSFVIDKSIFQDHVFSSNKAVDKLEADDTNNYTYEKESKYNYYVNSYEKLLASSNSPPTYNLPNYYLLAEENLSDTNEPEQYYDSYVSEWLNEPIQAEKTKNIMFECDYTNSGDLVETEIVPFYNKISFSLEKDKTKIRNNLYSLQKRKEVLNLLMFTIFAIEQTYSKEQLSKIYSYQDKKSLETEENKSLFSIDFIGITGFLYYLFNLTSSGYDFYINKITILKELDLETAPRLRNLINDHALDLFNMGSILYNQFDPRSLREIFKGSECYSETLFYKIEKYEEGIEEPIQNIWVSNDNVRNDIFDYIDTQVKYNTNYTYVVKSYKYLLGNNYRYTKKEQYDDMGWPGKSYKIEARNQLEPHIVATEYARISAIAIDKPPPAPEIDVIPYKDNDEKVLVLFNPSSVEYKRVPVSFSDEEREFYQRIQNYQRSQDGKITFGGDDKTKKYYVYRIEEHPSSYDDFADALYAEIEPECNCTTAEYIQGLETNKKYYFVFRSVDVHGHISYPTQPFLVELINEGGTTFLDFRGVDFINKDYKSLTKGAKRFIHIKPNLQQSLLRITDPDRASALGAIEARQYDLGQEELENRIWGKNFKLKIKSKNTKKEINIKFKFVKKENKDLIRNLEESCE